MLDLMQCEVVRSEKIRTDNMHCNVRVAYGTNMVLSTHPLKMKMGKKERQSDRKRKKV